MSRMPKPMTVEGRIENINISPRGDIEGLLVATADGTVQVNFDKKGAPSAAQWPVGKRVRLAAVLEEEGFAHPVYQLAELGADVEGEVVRLNYARHGEVNGYVLASGVFVHVKPDGAKRFRVKVGDRIRASGERRSGSAAEVVDATDVVRLRAPARAVAS